MKSEDTVEDPLMSVQFYKRARVFSFRITVHLLFSFFFAKDYKSAFLPRYESLKVHHDRSYIVTSDDTFEDLLMGVQFYIKSEIFFNSRYSPSTVFIFTAKRRLNLCFYHAMSL